MQDFRSAQPVIAKTIAVTTHGRYLVEEPAAGNASGMLVGFHGYAEDAAIQMARLRSIEGADQWVKVSILGLHRFYQRRTNSVVAGWMTSEDRELAIGDNIAYVKACVDAVWKEAPAVVFAGFSQGVAMAFRAAANAGTRPTAVLAAGGDIPPELKPDELARIRCVVLVRGESDDWYTKEQFQADERRLRHASVDVRLLEFSGGHEWPAELNRIGRELLRSLT